MFKIPKRISTHQRSEIVKSMFSGCSRDSIARDVHVSGGTASHVLRDFKNDAYTTGIQEAEKMYNLEEMVASY